MIFLLPQNLEVEVEVEVEEVEVVEVEEEVLEVEDQCQWEVFSKEACPNCDQLEVKYLFLLFGIRAVTDAL